jgi:hypothetical protein
MAITIPSHAAQELRENLIPEEALSAIELALPIIDGVCERAGMDFDVEEGDDANLFGQQCSRRGRNLIAREAELRELAGVRVCRPRNTMYLQAGPTQVHFWAAGDDEGSPRLRGGKTKPEILDQVLKQLPLWKTARVEPPAHLVVAYRATPASRRLEKVVVGVPKGVDSWDFAVELYDRPVEKVTDRPKPTPAERFDAQPAPAPVIELRPRRDEKQK